MKHPLIVLRVELGRLMQDSFINKKMKDAFTEAEVQYSDILINNSKSTDKSIEEVLEAIKILEFNTKRNTPKSLVVK